MKEEYFGIIRIVATVVASLAREEFNVRLHILCTGRGWIKERK